MKEFVYFGDIAHFIRYTGCHAAKEQRLTKKITWYTAMTTIHNDGRLEDKSCG